MLPYFHACNATAKLLPMQSCSPSVNLTHGDGEITGNFSTKIFSQKSSKTAHSSSIEKLDGFDYDENDDDNDDGENNNEKSVLLRDVGDCVSPNSIYNKENSVSQSNLMNVSRPLIFGLQSSPLHNNLINDSSDALNTSISSSAFAHSNDSASKNQNCKPFSCNRCERTFNSKYNVIRHLKQYHAEKRMFKCSVCGRDYKWVDSLHKHMKLHKQISEENSTSQSLS
jgi:hypothetical protein